MTDVDPRLLAYAEECVQDMVRDVGRQRLPPEDRPAVAKMLAIAIQLAAEDEYAEIVELLLVERLSMPRTRRQEPPK